MFSNRKFSSSYFYGYKNMCFFCFFVSECNFIFHIELKQQQQQQPKKKHEILLAGNDIYSFSAPKIYRKSRAMSFYFCCFCLNLFLLFHRYRYTYIFILKVDIYMVWLGIYWFNSHTIFGIYIYTQKIVDTLYTFIHICENFVSWNDDY